MLKSNLSNIESNCSFNSKVVVNEVDVLNVSLPKGLYFLKGENTFGKVRTHDFVLLIREQELLFVGGKRVRTNL